MDNSTQQTELIMRYLDDEMSRMEKDEFEKRLASDQSMQQELNDLKIARDAVKMFGLKQQVASVRQEMNQETPVKRISAIKLIKYSLAAAASVVFIAISLLAYNFFSLSAGKLYNDKYSSFELSTVRSVDEVSSTEVEKAYRSKNYDEVTKLSARTSALNTGDKFLTGVSYLELNKPAEAIAFLNQVIDEDKRSDHSIYKDEAEYYLALSYLKTKNYEKAIALMKTIHDDPSHLYHEKFTNGFIRKVKMLRWR